MILSFIAFFLIFSLLVLIHEFGHFIAAKKNGVRVDEFGFGFPPKLFSKKIGGTEYSINLIPFGGFVRIPGSEYEEYDKSDSGSFSNKSILVKVLILTGGIIMNLILAALLYYGLFAARNFTSMPIYLLDDYKFRYGTEEIIPNVIFYADEGGKFKPGDQILSISYVDGQDNLITIFPKDINEVTSFISDKKDTNLAFKVKNVNTGKQYSVTAKTYFDGGFNRYMVGIGLGEVVMLKYTKPVERIFVPFLHSANLLSYSSNIFSSMIKTSVETKDVKPVASTLTGPVGIFFIVEGILTIGGVSALLALVDFIALLSLSLAIMNILPFPGLDGGHLIFVGYEAIFRKPPPLKIMRWTTTFGMGFLIILAVLVAFKDFFMFR